MDASKALWGALMIVSMSLAGCAGGDEPLGIKVTPADDPVTEPTIFEATGSAESFTWDFGDGTGLHDGRRVEHVFGFTDGEVTVRMTAQTADGPKTFSEKVDLGGARNAIPVPAMIGSTNWVEPGDPVRISAAGSTDDNGDPLLFRWSCQALGPALPAHGDDHGTGGLPFGIQVLGSVSANITEPDRTVEGDLCTAFESEDAFSRDATIEGTFENEGVYNIDVEIRDPKSPSQIGRMVIFVTPGIPPVEETLSLTGTLTAGSGGQVQNIMEQITNPTGLTWDQEEQEFRLPLPIDSATLAFAVSSQAPQSAVTYAIEAGGSEVVPATSDETTTFGFHDLLGGQNYDVIFTLESGVEVSYTWDLAVVYDMDPTVLWEAPLPA